MSARKYKVNTEKLNLRSAPIVKPETIIGVLSKGDIVTKIKDSDVPDWWEVSTEINGETVTGFANAKLLSENDSITTLAGRGMYIWKLRPVLTAEMDVETFVKKARKAKLSSVWIKVAEGGSEYENIAGAMTNRFIQAREELKNAGVAVWGWHVPYCKTKADAKAEAKLVSRIAEDFSLDGILMDAESEAAFFKGTAETAEVYAKELKELLAKQNKGLAISSHDIPGNFPGFPFDAFARHATVNAPQVYYGGSPSVEKRLNRAIDANHHLSVPFVPVGAGWVGPAGGCASASACAERAIIFMRLVRERGYQGYSFWHWQGAPAKLWEVLFTEPV